MMRSPDKSTDRAHPNLIPWRAFCRAGEFLVGQVAQNPAISPVARQAATQRLRELASTFAQTVQTGRVGARCLPQCRKRHRLKRRRYRRGWKPACQPRPAKGPCAVESPAVQYKGKTSLACNDFAGQSAALKDALEAGRERNYGPSGEAGWDGLACAVANQRLSQTTTTPTTGPFCRAMWDCSDHIPSRDVARQAAESTFGTPCTSRIRGRSRAAAKPGWRLRKFSGA